MRVVTNKICYITSGHSATHKQGKIPAGVVLNTMSETSKAYELEPDHAKAVIEVYDPDRNSDYSKYPAFWVQKDDVIAEAGGPIPAPQPSPLPVGGIADEQAGRGLILFLKWLIAEIKR